MADIFDILRYEHDKGAYPNVPETYVEVANVSMLAVEPGEYEFGYSAITTYDQTTKSLYGRFSTDGGSTWTEVRVEPKDNTNIVPEQYQFIETVTVAGDLSLIVQARKEDAIGTFDLVAINAWIKRMK